MIKKSLFFLSFLSSISYASVIVNPAKSTGGGGYAVQPATVTFQLNKGFSASTGTFTSLSPGVMHIVAGSSNVTTGLVSLSTEVTGILPAANLPTNSTNYIQNTLTPGTTTQKFSVQVASATNVFSTNDYYVGADPVLRVLQGGRSAGNAFSGVQTGNTTMTGSANSIFGFNCGTKLTSGIDNVFIGVNAGQETTSGSYNMFLGRIAGSGNVTGSFNSYVGRGAGANCKGSDNSYIGYLAAQGADTASQNTIIGSQSGPNVVTGTYLTLIGYGSDAVDFPTPLTNATAIGANAVAKQSNTVVIGNNTDMGVGTSYPRERLEVIDYQELGPELITNGEFTVNTNGWTAGNGATLASVAGGVSGNNLEITNDASFTQGSAYQGLNTTIGGSYQLTFYWRTDPGTNSIGANKVSDGSSFDNGSISDSGGTWFDDSYQWNGPQTVNFIATSTTTFIDFLNSDVLPGYVWNVDNVSVKQITGGNLLVNSTVTASNVRDTSLTSGRVPFVFTGGLISDSAQLTYSTTTATLSVSTSNANGGVDVIGGAKIMTNGQQVGLAISTYSSGAPYNLTTTTSTLAIGTSSMTITLASSGTYRIDGLVNLRYSGATFAANQFVTVNLYRQNNTPGVLSNSQSVEELGIVTTITNQFGQFNLNPIFYTTTNTNDVISLRGSISASPAAGNFQATEASLTATRLY